MRIESQPAYILHTRNFRDSSLIIECLTADYGRVSGIVKGVRSNSKTAKQRRSSTQPFVPLLISWTGKPELKTVTSLESRGTPVALQGIQLFSALYVNELLTRLLQPAEEHTDIYTLYEWTLNSLVKEVLTDRVLRLFELQLLDYLGYGIDFSNDFNTEKAIVAGQVYRYKPERGFTAIGPIEFNQLTPSAKGIYNGEDLLAISSGRYNEQTRRVAKRLCREALRSHLGSKPLKSRELFR